MAEVSILIPHFNVPPATRALTVCLKCLAENTPLDYELIVTAHREREFAAFNRMARAATSEWLVMMNSDMFVAPNWLEALWELRAEDTLVLACLVETDLGGGVTAQSLTANYGKTPEAYNRAGFESFAATRPTPPDVFAWTFPYLLHRQTFLDMGGYSEQNVEQNINDLLFMEAWRASGRKQVRVSSYAYHLSRWTLTAESRPA